MKLKEIKEFLMGKNDDWLFSEATRLRAEIFSNEIYLRGIVEFSNICKDNCLYCGLRSGNSNIARYRLTIDEILDTIKLVAKSGMGTVVLQSGNDPYFDARIIKEIIVKAKQSDIAVTLSLGERSTEELKLWKEAGADRYLIKVETFNEKVYEYLRPGRKLSERLKMIDELRELGYEVGSGIIIGLPGITVSDLARDILKLTQLDLHMLAAGPFVPHRDTPLRDSNLGDLNLSFRVMALIRILNEYANIPSTSAMESIEKGARLKGIIIAGANVIMPSFTPERVRKLYNIYPGKNEFSISAIEYVNNIKTGIVEAGFVASTSKGFYKGEKKRR